MTMGVIMKAIVRSVFAVLFVLAVTLPALGQGEDGDDLKNCYNVYGEARYGALAYKHIVIFQNRCDLILLF